MSRRSMWWGVLLAGLVVAGLVVGVRKWGQSVDRVHADTAHILKIMEQCPSRGRPESLAEAAVWILKPIAEPSLKVLGKILGEEVEKALKGEGETEKWSVSENGAMFERVKSGVKVGVGCIVVARGAVGQADITQKLGGDFWDKPGGQVARTVLGLVAVPAVYIELEVKPDDVTNPKSVSLEPRVVYVEKKGQKRDVVVAVSFVEAAGSEPRVYGFQGIVLEKVGDGVLRQLDAARPSQASGFVRLPGINEETLKGLAEGQKSSRVLVKADVVETSKGESAFEKLKKLAGGQ